MIYRYISKFSTLFYGISYYFCETSTEIAVGRKICEWLYCNPRKKGWKMSVIMTSFSNDESARPPTLVKTDSTTKNLIDQVRKFQSSYFKGTIMQI